MRPAWKLPKKIREFKNHAHWQNVFCTNLFPPSLSHMFFLYMLSLGLSGIRAHRVLRSHRLTPYGIVMTLWAVLVAQCLKGLFLSKSFCCSC